jgi:hypothetical protein
MNERKTICPSLFTRLLILLVIPSGPHRRLILLASLQIGIIPS